ncbi:hypothetical protein EVAR_56999_1 [Eumeta japonica]|uniref:Uncharacterized protein n=1 Tax=Eumeta variegata TaxID=151549 RepID=A0A4C1Z5E3_EUMVA|nr:hypothetical protein EVAR_56999_1 [Eumeta japonica]
MARSTRSDVRMISRRRVVCMTALLVKRAGTNGPVLHRTGKVETYRVEGAGRALMTNDRFMKAPICGIRPPAASPPPLGVSIVVKKNLRECTATEGIDPFERVYGRGTGRLSDL